MRVRVVFLISLLLSGLVLADEERLAEVLTGIPVGKAYTPIDAQTEDEGAAGFERMLACDKAGTLLWTGKGYTVHESGPDETIPWLLLEDDAPQGQGHFLIRCTETLPVMIVAPHACKDLHTREIGVYLATKRHVSAFAWNSVPRTFENDHGETIDADLAHLRNSYLNSLTRAFARVYPHGYLVFLHGYAQEQRETQLGRELDVILSSGSEKPERALFDIKESIEARLGVHAGIYPFDVRELGGTTCVQRKILSNAGHKGFIHIEMSYPVRKRLATDAQAMETFADCLLEALKDKA